MPVWTPIGNENVAQTSCLQQAGSLRYGIFAVILLSTGIDAYPDIIPSTQAKILAE
ncbi:MAG: hypothetical protein ONB51_08395 [candidate division KSB1 bacterium]|nr:hypothetical protein [candidate division KSB1 bacterium]